MNIVWPEGFDLSKLTLRTEVQVTAHIYRSTIHADGPWEKVLEVLEGWFAMWNSGEEAVTIKEVILV